MLTKIPCRTSALTGWAWLMELLSNKTRCHENLRMSRELFLALCGELVNKYELLVTDKGDCIGAIDGTHVEARLPPEKAVPYFVHQVVLLQVQVPCPTMMGSMSDQRDFIRQKVVRQATRQSGR
ncbi:hypothetical protein Acr_00g0031280 [Actinidia rufa]|uniref:DUF8040 domain-containing protein n=1 Tax=Actinidia rufa TaxID=165716 RepID=A0A7J0DFJ8_9ERIC|nr:hypothetical protein Acr_00g0031280 [Actinidia rufa]